MLHVIEYSAYKELLETLEDARSLLYGKSEDEYYEHATNMTNPTVKEYANNECAFIDEVLSKYRKSKLNYLKALTQDTEDK